MALHTFLTPLWIQNKAQERQRGEIPSKSSFPSLALFGGSAAGAGFLVHKTIGLQKGFDHLAKGVEAAEYLSPGFIGKTFRLSEILSPFETAKEFHWKAHHLKDENFQKYLSKLTGLSLKDLVKADAFQSGIRYIPSSANKGRLVTGSGTLLKSNVSLLKYEQNKASVGNWYARTFGLDFGDNLFGDKDFYQAPKFLPIEAVSSGTRSRVRYAHGIAGQIVGRFNTLLSDPFESEYLGKLVKNVPILERLNLSVKPGTPGKMLARYTGKALAFGGILAGLQYFDYRRRNGNRLGVIPEMALYGGLSAAALAPKGGSLKKYALVGGIAGAAIGALPTFNKGIFAGVGNLWAGLNLTRSAVSDVLGLTEAVKSQEQYLPGSTKLTTAMGFVGAGALYAGFAQYTRRLALTSRFASRERGLASGTLQAQRFLSLLPSLQANKFANWAHQKNLPKGLTNVLSTVIGSKWGVRGAALGGAVYGGFSALGALSAGSPLSAATFAAGTALGLFGLSLREAAKGTKAATKLSKKGLVLAAAGLLLPFALRSNKSTSELWDIYSGNKDIPVMKSRWWPSNRSPWEGSKPIYYRKHWVAAIGDASKEKALYGSEEAYWDTDPLASPLNWIRDPYAREKLMFSRGYRFPMTGQAFEETPVLGPLLTETIGKLIKPRKMMAPEEWLGADRPRMGMHAIGTGFGYNPSPTSEQGILPDRAGYPMPDRQGLGYGLSMQEHYMKEIVGLPGFVTESFQHALFGSKLIGGEEQTYLATSTQLGGLNRWYYDWNIGGGFGLTTEATRRFIPKDPGFEYYNPFRTDMPSWLPGDEAGYFLNFKSAEIFNQIAEPWRRLPGDGFLAANPEWEEHGLIDANRPLSEYPVAARYKITAGVAAWSRAAAGMRAHLTRTMKSAPDTLTPFEYSQIRETDEQLKAIKTKKLFDPYVTQSSGMEEMSLSVKGIDPSGLIQTEIGPLSLAGVNMTGAQLSRQAIQEDNSITIQEAARRAQQRGLGIGKFVKGYLSPGDRITAYVNKEIGGRYLKEESGITVPAVVISGGNNLNQALLQEGLTGSQGVNDNALNFKGVYGDSPLRKAWDIVTHAADTPFEALTPLAPAAKFIHRATALEDYQRNQVFGREIALWQEPYEHFIKPFFNRLTNNMPQSEIEQRDIEEYFDKLKYVKYKALSETATDPRLRSEYKRQIDRTMTGINPFSPYIFSKSAFPAEVRPYLDSFLNEQDPEERKKILQTVAPSVGRAISGKWLAQELQGLKTKGEVTSLSFGETQRIDELEDMSRRETYEGDKRKDAEVAQYFKSHKLPDVDFTGWYGQADLEDYKLAYVNKQGADMHDYGLWEDQKRSLLRKPYVANELEEVDPFASELNIGNPYQDLRASLRSRHIGSIQFKYGGSVLRADELQVDTEEDISQDVVQSVNESLM